METVPVIMKQNLLKYAAFTLVEILVSLSLILLLTGLGYAGYRDFSRRQTLLSAARKIEGDLRYAQGLANSGTAPASPASCTNLSGYRFLLTASAYTISALCTEGYVDVKKDVSPGANITISSTLPSFLFKVLASGTNIPEATPVTITLRQTGVSASVAIKVNSAGQVSLLGFE